MLLELKGLTSHEFQKRKWVVCLWVVLQLHQELHLPKKRSEKLKSFKSYAPKHIRINWKQDIQKGSAIKWTSSTGPQSLTSSSETQEALKTNISLKTHLVAKPGLTLKLFHHFFYPPSISTDASPQKYRVRLPCAIPDPTRSKIYGICTIITFLKSRSSEFLNTSGPKNSR